MFYTSVVAARSDWGTFRDLAIGNRPSSTVVARLAELSPRQVVDMVLQSGRRD